MSKLITVTVLLLLIISLPAVLYLVSKQTQFFSKASAGSEPNEIQITNLADNSFTVSFTTTAQVPVFIQYGASESLGFAATDDQDQSNSSPRFTHHITLKNLDPETEIYYKINSGGKIFDKSGQPFQQRTAQVVKDTPPLPSPVFGKVIFEDKSTFKEAVVYLKLKDGQKLSSFIREGGNFLIVLNSARTENLSSFVSPKAGDNMKITVRSANNQIIKETKYSGENKPLSDITI
ncbi:fibronectin type III domain-containing protein [Candidatus Daviesbacteria bacterium]|nr:fibronectin type III domain-containing protein [Candidatus Daviesbacteria bacterium]